ncbi:hypothetical protein EAS62_37140 [Bradyrhizobium zhanjiangense]|uniref:Uncharacterized protein n=1 Tax=Bradyrhizobium zhanjiangense TaxID=1325107 RepID=A0ABY0DAU6_9BRAD|nr:hypothetical protein EAS62_37140 [Bradyrhizobium zhanjiangense]
MGHAGIAPSLDVAADEPGRRARRLALQAPRQQLLGAMRMINIPGLAQRLASGACRCFGRRSTMLWALWI